MWPLSYQSALSTLQHRIEVLFRRYAKFLDGIREQANRLIEQSMKERGRVSRGEAPES
ncbi:hypothetical protein SAMN02787118_101205 [Streptomyces mirabilis]|uniref:Uncharacterized protein n=1 Tax=Streptomyces mirabilis TaxID=68239 RepID=A0A1I1Z9V6_9ACTN|nr:hypothetical protein SAMN02787118_101205 [Streptomyces mirabilis]